MNLKEQELTEIEGGGSLLGLGKLAVFGGLVTFVIGAVNGYLRPLTCGSDK